MWKLDLKYKCIHKYIYDLINIYIYRKREMERDNLAVIVGLFEGTSRRWERKRE
jgi:hypothetical protein